MNINKFIFRILLLCMCGKAIQEINIINTIVIRESFGAPIYTREYEMEDETILIEEYFVY